LEIPIYPNIPEDLELIETFLWDPDKGAPDIDLHLERLCRSAADLKFKFEISEIKKKIVKIKSQSLLRCRLTLRFDGKINITTAPLILNSTTWILGLSETILSSSDPWLLHKSSNRGLYDAERANLPHGIDEFIYLNERNEVCEGTITNIFVKKAGQWITPPLSSGCLPGVLRRKKIEDGSCKVKIVTFSDLHDAEKITVGNALRGEIEAVLNH
jgi:4-amino-4-deoxychorismate lyase